MKQESRYGQTRKKHISLSVEGHNRIAEWAQENGLSFSVAIEALALQAMQEDTLVILARLLRSMLRTIIRYEFRQQFNRFAKLTGLAALAANESSLKLDALLLQFIRQEAEANPRFVQSMKVTTDPDDPQAAQIREFRDQLSRAAKVKALESLRKPMEEVALLLAETTGTVEES